MTEQPLHSYRSSVSDANETENSPRLIRKGTIEMEDYHHKTIELEPIPEESRVTYMEDPTYIGRQVEEKIKPENISRL